MSPAFEERRHVQLVAHELELVDLYRIAADGYDVADNIVRGDE